MEMDKQTKVADANNRALEDTARSTHSASPNDAKSRADVGADGVQDRQSVLNGAEFAVSHLSNKRQVLASLQEDDPPPDREGQGGSRWG